VKPTLQASELSEKTSRTGQGKDLRRWCKSHARGERKLLNQKRRKKPENEVSQALQQWCKPQQKSDSPGRKAQEGRRHWFNRKKEPPSEAQAGDGRYRKVAGEDADRF
jgi:hypothetical protein